MILITKEQPRLITSMSIALIITVIIAGFIYFVLPIIRGILVEVIFGFGIVIFFFISWITVHQIRKEDMEEQHHYH